MGVAKCGRCGSSNRLVHWLSGKKKERKVLCWDCYLDDKKR